MTYRERLYTVPLLALIFMSASLQARSHSYFSPRSMSHHSVYEHALRTYETYYNPLLQEEGRSFIHIMASPFYSQTVKEQDLGCFFTPCNKNPFIAQGDGGGNVDSRVFSILNPTTDIGPPPADELIFHSRNLLLPKRSAYGAHISARIDLSYCVEHLWFHIDFAAMGIKHQLQWCESEIRNPGEVNNPDETIRSKFANMATATRNKEWNHGQVPGCDLRDGGVDDIQLKLGYDWTFCPFGHFSLYALGSVPTGSRQRSEYIFEPIVGSKHGGIGAGLYADWQVFSCGHHVVTMMLDWKYRYLFGAKQFRSFDLKGRGDWSRYLNVAPLGGESIEQFLPGINIFTLLADVNPRSQAELWCALHYEWRNAWHFEFGYDFWWRAREDVCNPCAFDERFGFHRFPVPPATDTSKERFLHGPELNISGSTATGKVDGVTQTTGPLAGSGATDATLRVHTVADLNLCAAEHPRAVSHTIYGAFAHDNTICERHVMYGIGGSYEIPQDKKFAFEQWVVWGTFAVRF